MTRGHIGNTYNRNHERTIVPETKNTLNTPAVSEKMSAKDGQQSGKEGSGRTVMEGEKESFKTAAMSEKKTVRDRASNQSKTEASFQTVMSGSKKTRSKVAVSEKMSMRDSLQSEKEELSQTSKSGTEKTGKTAAVAENTRRDRAMATQAETLSWHAARWGCPPSSPLLPGSTCPAFSLLALLEDGQATKVFSRESLAADYVVLLFLPMDGSVDTTELAAFRDQAEVLEGLQCQLVGVSGDSILSIQQWAPGCGFPILSDKSLCLAKCFGVKRPSGMLTRATFLLDKQRKVRHCSVYPRCVARSPEEVVRQVEAAQQIDTAQEQISPLLAAGWQPGQQPLPSSAEERRSYLGLDMEEQQEEQEDGEGGKEQGVKGKKVQELEQEHGGRGSVPASVGPSLGGLFSHLLVDEGGPGDLQYFLQGL